MHARSIWQMDFGKGSPILVFSLDSLVQTKPARYPLKLYLTLGLFSTLLLVDLESVMTEILKGNVCT